MSKRKIKIIITAIVILTALVCVLPLPKRIEKDYYAVDTFSEENAVISVDVTYLNFLFLKDKMIGKIQVFDDGEIYTYSSKSLFYIGKWPSENRDEFVHAFSGFYNNPTIYWGKSNGIEGSQMIGAESVSAYLSRDFKKIIIRHQERGELKEGQTRQEVGLETARNRQYVGNTEKDGISETVKYFGGYVKEAPAQ